MDIDKAHEAAVKRRRALTKTEVALLFAMVRNTRESELSPADAGKAAAKRIIRAIKRARSISARPRLTP